MGALPVSPSSISHLDLRRWIVRLRRTPQGRAGAYVGAVGLLAGAYYLAGKIGLELAYLDGAVAALWPPAGFGLAVLFLAGNRLWPGIVLGDLLLGDFSTPFATVIAQTAGNTLALVVAVTALRRLTGGRGDLARVGDVLSLVVCAVLAAVISGAIGPLALRLGGVIESGQLWEVLRTWILGDACGVLVVAPALLTWVAAGSAGIRRRHLVEGAGVMLVLAILAELPPQRDVPFIVFPVLLWAALRLGPRGAATAILVVCSITVWNTAQSDGPFVRDSITDSLLVTQLFIATSAITSLLLAAVTAERTRAEAAQRALAEEQAALRRVATLVAGDPSPSRVFAAVTEEVGRLLGLPGANVMQLDGPERATVVGAWSEHGPPRFPVGATLRFDGDTLVPKVARSGRPQRVERYEQANGSFAAKLRRVGYRAGVAAPVTVGGRLWGVLAAVATSEDPLPPELEQRLCDFADLVAQALANADAYEKLAASRARVVEVGDAERRRLKRNLHDGAQQRLVSVALGLSVVGSKLESDPGTARKILSNAQEDLAAGLAELRELARGIHPAVLTEHGLGPALHSLLARAPVAVEIVGLPEERLPPTVEAAAYYVVAEAVTNVGKYAQASEATVGVERSNSHATVTVCDDGIGGADPAKGSGLDGLAARVESLRGRLAVDSPQGRGTRITAEIPL
jgi:signal transduction histidine kinase